MHTNTNPADTLPARQPSSRDADIDGVSYFVEQMGLTSQTDGLPRIAGRIAGYFIIHGGPVSFAQLAEELKVSRGSVSTNARMLVTIGFIEKVTIPGDRQDYYQLSDAPFLRMIDGYLQRMRHMQSIVETADNNIPTALTDTKKRLQQMRHFYREAVLSNELLLERLSGAPDSRN
ncbi:GbsR/MarR family transcriptional regulator [Pseudohongiella sp.]|uniref:HTH marR-type domain-containing protein n=1 Tax=marine sediment metagenome TaxID=412755 RepID=A0A0F9VZ50_9ZZZZ|nr:MarR family transcriptional regulator [Pseudohongiella sp.]HDZ10486.1 MarR family transcriptional regulator [Pseudohongiella sp.]HEA63879.1 MarR family transcriptional regulator [Pseudohongiella sp.]